MSGMYPNNQVLEIFGEQFQWPGLGPDGKFTNGSFSDPAVKPSFIPAETLNLIIDNLQNAILASGLNPNSIEPDQLARALEKGLQPRIIGEYHDLAYEPSAAELIRLRLLPLKYQIIRIELYQALCGIKWVGSAANNTADWWYKCDENGTRNGGRIGPRPRLYYKGAGV